MEWSDFEYFLAKEPWLVRVLWSYMNKGWQAYEETEDHLEVIKPFVDFRLGGIRYGCFGEYQLDRDNFDSGQGTGYMWTSFTLVYCDGPEEKDFKYKNLEWPYLLHYSDSKTVGELAGFLQKKNKDNEHFRLHALVICECWDSWNVPLSFVIAIIPGDFDWEKFEKKKGSSFWQIIRRFFSR